MSNRRSAIVSIACIILMIGAFALHRLSRGPVLGSTAQLESIPDAVDVAPVIIVDDGAKRSAVNASARTAQAETAAVEAAVEACDAFDVWVASASIAAPASTTDDAPAGSDDLAGRDPVMVAATVDQGIGLAVARRQALKTLIQNDPRAAIERALPYAARRALPRAIQDQLETQISARGDLLARAALPLERDGRPTVDHVATIDGRPYSAHVYGWRAGRGSQADIPLQGVVLDDEMAVDERSVRLVSRDEIVDRGLTASAICPVSGAPSAAGVVAQVAGAYHPLCNAGHIDDLEAGIRAAQGGDSSGSLVQAPPTSWTTGPKRVLVMRVDTWDNPGEPYSTDHCARIMSECDAFFRTQSYGKTSLSSTVTPVIRLPRSAEWYRSNDVSYILEDARAASRAAGYDPYAYELDIVTYSNLGGSAGLGYVGWRGTWATEFTFRVVAHELGHNFGLWHANAWIPTDGTPNGAGWHQEYGEPYDTMGGWGEPNNHFNAYEKNLLGWLDDARVQTVGSSGVFHIAPHDATSSGIAAVKIVESTGTQYWFSTRALRPYGVYVNRFYPGIEGYGSQLLDMTPTSSGGTGDAGMYPGTSLVDLSPVPFSVTTERWYGDGSADIRVDMGGAPPNQPPVARLAANPVSGVAPLSVGFDASASSDPDGRIAYYAWNFGDGVVLSESGPYASHTYGAGSYTATVVATDDQGATNATSITITVTNTPPPPPPGDGTGLLAQYWSDHGDFAGSPTLSRVDETVDFDWGGNSPAGGVSSDWFTARWTGQVQPPVSGTYTFTTTGDDGVRLWVDGQLVIDAWYPQSPTEHSGAIALSADRRVDLRLEYFEQGGGAVARLAWTMPDGGRAIVPRSVLYPATDGGSGSARVNLSVDNMYTDVIVNGSPLPLGPNVVDWQAGDEWSVSGAVQVLAVRADNYEPGSNWAGLIATVVQPDGTRAVSDATWRVHVGNPEPDAQGRPWYALGYDDSGWSAATAHGAYGVAPWGTHPALDAMSGAQWIWAGDPAFGVSPVYLRKVFTAGAQRSEPAVPAVLALPAGNG